MSNPARIRSAVLALTFFFATAISCAHELRGRVVGITDGDTITVLDRDRSQAKIRLAGIDAPERSQAFGLAAKQKVSDLVFKRDVVVRWSKRDRYGRVVGVVLVDGRDAGLALVEAGLAWHFKRYASEQSPAERTAYAAAEERARAARIGLWRDSQVTAPWDFRK